MRRLMIGMMLCYSSIASAQNMISIPSNLTPYELRLESTSIEPIILSPSSAPASSQLLVQQFRSKLAISKNETDTLTQYINLAIIKKDWFTLKSLVADYSKLPQHDTTLVLYAEALIANAEDNYILAIRRFRQILARHPDLDYVRLDLAVSLARNKEYAAAINQFEKLQSANLSPSIQRISQSFIERIQKQQSWQWTLGLNYTHDNNVNNASSIKEFDWNNQRWIKNEDSLPKSAQGIEYSLGIKRDFNLDRNHYLSLETQFAGLHYWNASDYSERSLYAALGYTYQNYRHKFSIAPFITQHWLGGERYSLHKGWYSAYSILLNDRWRLNTRYSYTRKTYSHPLLNRFEGKKHTLQSHLNYSFSPQLLLFVGFDYQEDRLNSRSESSTNKGILLGFAQEWPLGISHSINIRYGRRDFHHQHFFFPFKRSDKEWLSTLSVWNRNWHFYGITPRLNFQYRKIDSNIPAFYSYSNKQIFVSFEKTF